MSHQNYYVILRHGQNDSYRPQKHDFISNFVDYDNTGLLTQLIKAELATRIDHSRTWVSSKIYGSESAGNREWLINK